jgi:hypothetical protein
MIAWFANIYVHPVFNSYVWGYPDLYRIISTSTRGNNTEVPNML